MPKSPDLRIYLHWPLPTLNHFRDPEHGVKENIKRWIEKGINSIYQTKLDENTTHLVVDEKFWREQIPVVKKALEVGNGLKIVSPDWLEETLKGGKKVREGPYLWAKIAPISGSGLTSLRGKDANEPRTHTALLAEVFHDATDPFLDEREKRRIDVENEARERAEAEQEAEDKARKEEERKKEAERRKEIAALKRKGGVKSRGEVFRENYHVYTDATGFEYDITLTKVETKQNRNERLVLTFQIFESNPVPAPPRSPDQTTSSSITAPPTRPRSNEPTYATNLHFAGTTLRPQNNLLAAHGSNLATAMRIFRAAFREKTGISWDDRIVAHNARVAARTAEAENAKRATKAELREVRSEVRKLEESVPFDKRMFVYVPPSYGAKGEIGGFEEDGVANEDGDGLGEREGSQDWGGEAIGDEGEEESEVQGVRDNMDLVSEGGEADDEEKIEDVETDGGKPEAQGPGGEEDTKDELDAPTFVPDGTAPAGEENDSLVLYGNSEFPDISTWPDMDFGTAENATGGSDNLLFDNSASAGTANTDDPTNALLFSNINDAFKNDTPITGEAIMGDFDFGAFLPPPTAEGQFDFHASAALPQDQNTALPFTGPTETQFATDLGQMLLSMEVPELPGLDHTTGETAAVAGEMDGLNKRKRSEVEEPKEEDCEEDWAAKRLQVEAGGAVI